MCFRLHFKKLKQLAGTTHLERRLALREKMHDFLLRVVCHMSSSAHLEVLTCDARIAVRREVCYRAFALNRGL